jgi:hypothetical protein
MKRRVLSSMQHTIKLDVAIFVLLLALVALYGFPIWLLAFAIACAIFVGRRSVVAMNRKEPHVRHHVRRS